MGTLRKHILDMPRPVPPKQDVPRMEDIRDLSGKDDVLKFILAFVLEKYTPELIQKLLEPVTDAHLLGLIKPLIPETKDGRTPTSEELIALIRPLIPEVQHGTDGHTPTRNELLALIKPLITDVHVPTEKELSALILKVLFESEDFRELIYSQLSAELVRDKLASLTGNNRLDASAIKNLPAKKMFGGLLRSAVSGGSSATTTSETFTTAGGSETLTLTTTPTAILLVMLGSNAIFETDDYTASGTGVTLLNPDIPAGIKVKVIYTT